MYPKISVITQCFNRKEYIAETIESVLSQGYPNLEYIIVDGDSTDGSWEIIQSYKDKLTHCVQLNDTRPTPIHGYNHGIGLSTGEIIATINDKNLLMPKSLFAVGQIFQTYPDIEWLTGIGLLVNRDSIITHVIPVRKDFYEHLMHVPWNIQHESTFWRRSLWERTGGAFDDEYPLAFDIGTWRKFFFEAKLYHLNTILGAYRKLPTAQSSVRRDEFYESCARARKEMRARASFKQLCYTELYRVLRLGKFLLRNIPDGVYAHIPILNIFCNEAVSFQSDNGAPPYLRRYKRNPFRTIFPW